MNIHRTTKIGPVLHVFVSEDQGLLFNDTEVSSPLHGTAWIRVSRGVTQWSGQSSEFAPEIEGTDTVFFMGEPQSPSLGQKTWICASGD